MRGEGRGGRRKNGGRKDPREGEKKVPCGVSSISD